MLKFKPGEIVKYKLTQEMVMVVELLFPSETYYVRKNDFSQGHVYEFELEPIPGLEYDFQKVPN